MKHTQEKHWHYIESLGNDKYLNGSFFIGSGSIDETDYYFFFIETKHGHKRIKLKVDYTYIIETDAKNPEWVKVYTHYGDEDSFWKVWSHDFEHNKLYVPSGTIIRDFKVR